jgi:outer membrane lipoprotein-sorting protein
MEEEKMKITTTIGIILSLVAFSSSGLAQELTTEHVVARLDEKAKAFTSLEASISQTQVVDDIKASAESGKFFVKTSKTGPYVLWDITSPKRVSKLALIRDGAATVYFRETNTYRKNSVDPNSNGYQLLLTGFGVPAATLYQFYKPQVTGRETVDGVSTVVLDLTSTSPATGDVRKVTLWLDPKTWTPFQTRATQKAKGDYLDFKFSNVKLNKGISDSVFKVNIPKNANKQ